jgi:hypothetical protein
MQTMIKVVQKFVARFHVETDFVLTPTFFPEMMVHAEIITIQA